MEEDIRVFVSTNRRVCPRVAEGEDGGEGDSCLWGDGKNVDNVDWDGEVVRGRLDGGFRGELLEGRLVLDSGVGEVV